MMLFKQKDQVDIIKQIIRKLYKTIDGTYISLAERQRLAIVNTDLTYGEMAPEVFAEMLAVVKPQPGEVFYDLGSGTGKPIYTAALLYDWKKCCGVELLPGLFEVSCALCPRFLAMREVKKYFSGRHFPIEFVLQDFLQVDFQEADVVYVHASTFSPYTMEPLALKFRELKSGARIIINTKRLEDAYFEKISEDDREMEWGVSRVFTYMKK